MPIKCISATYQSRTSPSRRRGHVAAEDEQLSRRISCHRRCAPTTRPRSSWRRGYSQEVGAVPVHRVSVAGSRQVQVGERQRGEAEEDRCESHNPSGARPSPGSLSLSVRPATQVCLSRRRVAHNIPAVGGRGGSGGGRKSNNNKKRRRRKEDKKNAFSTSPVTVTTGWIGATSARLRVPQLRPHRAAGSVRGGGADFSLALSGHSVLCLASPLSSESNAGRVAGVDEATRATAFKTDARGRCLLWFFAQI